VVLEADPRRAAEPASAAWAPSTPQARRGRYPPEAAAAPHGPPERLTSREEEVAALVAQGLTNRQIAEELVVTRRTAENHVQNILRKLGLHSRVQLAVWVLSGDFMAWPLRSA
jgi:DNA-binding NarL/FixJ family response regulator